MSSSDEGLQSLLDDPVKDAGQAGARAEQPKWIPATSSEWRSDQREELFSRLSLEPLTRASIRKSWQSLNWDRHVVATFGVW
jgi:hypothetical protein